MFVEGDGGASGYYDTETVSSGPPLEAVITIPIRPGAAAGVKGTESTEKPSGYIIIYIRYIVIRGMLRATPDVSFQRKCLY